METAIIIVLAFMLLIAVTIFNIKYQACSSALDKSKIENEKLKSKNEKSNKENKYLISNNENLKIRNDEQEQKINKLKLSISDYSDSKINELETKYQSALKKIVERDEVIRLRNSEVIELEKTKKKYSQRVYELHGEKDFAIHQSKSSIKLCNEMSKMFKLMNSELESIETQLLEKIKL